MNTRSLIATLNALLVQNKELRATFKGETELSRNMDAYCKGKIDVLESLLDSLAPAKLVSEA